MTYSYRSDDALIFTLSAVSTAVKISDLGLEFAMYSAKAPQGSGVGMEIGRAFTSNASDPDRVPTWFRGAWDALHLSFRDEAPAVVPEVVGIRDVMAVVAVAYARIIGVSDEHPQGVPEEDLNADAQLDLAQWREDVKRLIRAVLRMAFGPIEPPPGTGETLLESDKQGVSSEKPAVTPVDSKSHRVIDVAVSVDNHRAERVNGDVTCVKLDIAFTHPGGAASLSSTVVSNDYVTAEDVRSEIRRIVELLGYDPALLSIVVPRIPRAAFVDVG